MSKLPRNLMVGNRVTVLKDIDLQPYTIVKAGERGTVVGVEDFIDVMMDTPHHGLDANVAWIEHDASGYIAAIRPPGPRWVPRLAAAVCVGFLFAGMVEVALARTLNIPSTVETLLLQGD